MTSRIDEERALRGMVHALRDEPVPAPDWEAVEQRLSRRLDEAERVARLRVARRPASPLWMGLPMVAAAAAIVLGVGLSGSSGPASPSVVARLVSPTTVALAAGEAGARGEHDLATLRVGDVVETGEDPATFVRVGSVRWSLAPGSRVVIRSEAGEPAVTDVTGGHVVALERGSLRAEVAPRDPALGLVEAFAVEVGGTRVAAHGTAFTVTRSAGGLIVDVEHGAVAVGPVGHVGTTSGHLLVGPSRAAFSLDGGRTARNLPSMGGPRAPQTPPADGTPGAHVGSGADGTPSAQVGSAAGDTRGVPGSRADDTRGALPAPRADAMPIASAESRPAAAGPAVAPPTPAPVAPAITAESVGAGLQRCFEQELGGGGSVLGLSVSSTLTVVVRDDGSVQSARFDPPLKAELQACASTVLAVRFADGPRTLTIPVAFIR